MDGDTVCVRVDPFEDAEPTEYRLSLDGGLWAAPGEDGYCSFPANVGLHFIACERLTEDGWTVACPTVTVHLAPQPDRSRATFRAAPGRPLGGGEGRHVNHCRGGGVVRKEAGRV